MSTLYLLMCAKSNTNTKQIQKISICHLSPTLPCLLSKPKTVLMLKLLEDRKKKACGDVAEEGLLIDKKKYFLPKKERKKCQCPFYQLNVLIPLHFREAGGGGWGPGGCLVLKNGILSPSQP